MAKLEAVLDIDINPFQRELEKAGEKAKEFGQKAAGIGNDLFKSLSGIDIAGALKIGVAVYAAKQLANALVDAAKQGYAAFQAYQDAVLRFKYTLPTPASGGAGAEAQAAQVVKIAGGKSGLFSGEQMRAAALYLVEASKELRESPEKLSEMLDTLKAFAIKTSTTPEEIAESYRRLVVGIKEEGGPAVGKFFKSTPGLEAETEKLRDAHAEAYLHAQGLTDASQANTAQAAEYQRLQKEPISEFMTQESQRKGATAVLEEIKGILERSAPKGIIAEAEKEHPEVMLNKAFGAINKAFGEHLKPAIDGFINAMTSIVTGALPAVKTSLSVLSDLFGILGETLKATGSLLYNTGTLFQNIITFGGRLPTIFDLLRVTGQLLANAWSALVGHAMADAVALSEHVDEVIAAKTAEKEAREASAKSAREALGAETGVFSKERVKSEEEVAKIGARADAAHEESQRRISFERAQTELRSQAQAAARATITGRRIGTTEDLTKQYAVEAESAAKIINIKATAAEKINAADEEAATRIGKIDEEQAIRNIERTTANAMDEGAEKAAALARLNAEDAAAQTARDDAHAEAAEKIRTADADAANQIIDAQIAAADRILDIQEAAALRQLEKMKGPYEAATEGAPAARPEFGHYRRGVYEESGYERTEREKRNAAAKAAADEANRDWKDRQKILIEHEFEEKKRAIEDSLERQRPTEIGLKRTHILQQEEHVKAIEAEKGRTEADTEFAKAHEGLELPTEPRKEAAGKADVSRKLLADILAKIFDGQKTQIKEFEEVFMKD
jgi:hypothetical protein